MNKSIAQIKLELHKATGGALPIGPPADVAAKLAALKEQMRQQGTNFDRRMQGVVNAEKTAGTGTVLPTDKAKGGLAHMDKGGQYPYAQAHEQARINAIKMLGLHEHNTAQDRAKAMGFDTDAYHVSDADILAFDNAKLGTNTSHLTGGDPKAIKSAMRGHWFSDRDLTNKNPRGFMFGDVVYPVKLSSHKKINDKEFGSQSYIVKDPKNIKSRFAAFDPARQHENDLLAKRGGSVTHAHLAIGGQGPKNWMKGKVEDVVKPLKQNLISGTDPAEALKQMQDQYSPEEMQKLSENARASVDRSFESLHRMNAMNQWVDRNLTNYIKKQMATHDDPIRKLAEQGITHLPNERFVENQAAGAHRVRHNAPRLGQSDEAKSWEDRSDLAMDTTNVGKVLGDEGMAHVYGEPWMQKADPETKLFKKGALMNSQMLGFDHLVDVLKQDLASGRIRPDQLSKVSIEHAVRRAHEYDQERKKAMAEAQLKATEGMPVHKEYPEGYKWIELALDKNLPEGHKQTPAGTYVDPQGNESIHHPNYAKLDDALKYEGETMGHCVGGYTPDVVSGKSRIFSLRDAKNEPHVTVEVKPSRESAVSPQEFYNSKDAPPSLLEKITQAEQAGKLNTGNIDALVQNSPEYKTYLESRPTTQAIKQIKGKGNAKPKKDYIPYVQDFVKSGNWSEVGDIKNADMIKHKGQYLTHAEHDDWLMNQLKPDEKARGGGITHAHHLDIEERPL